MRGENKDTISSIVGEKMVRLSLLKKYSYRADEGADGYRELA